MTSDAIAIRAAVVKARRLVELPADCAGMLIDAGLTATESCALLFDIIIDEPCLVQHRRQSFKTIVRAVHTRRR